ncbi:hypothetical protein DFH11DRAFT_1747280 [Phellopilus nigrolimitatus]|nr:hypothetical protein DFH11DRAFT_1747280 [Phellopilus nigrolimitatus]
MHYIRSDVEPVDPSLVPLFISELDIEQYTGVAILTLLVYNTIITMDKEIKYFWNRYIGILGAISGIVGLGFFWVQGLANILVIRVLALYHQDKRLAVCLRTLFGLEAAFGLALLIYPSIYEEIVVLELAEGVTVCGYNRVPPKVWGALSWAVPMLYGIILMILALYKAAEHWRETAGFTSWLEANYSDRVIFCSVMQIVSSQLFIPNVLLADFLTIFGSPSLLCVLGGHLLVRLKEAGERGANGGTSYKMKTMSNIEFS